MIDMDKYRMFTFGKYLSKLREVVESEKERQSSNKEKVGVMSPMSPSPMSPHSNFN